ncbi:MAG: CHAD domain-containing protein, partial [Thermoanaerobaculia bacterium]|nr:CHAD domain-containing protein [Thermoanaerobaculia bacterium]
HVHQLRVGIRRLRSALRSFQGWAPAPPAELVGKLRGLLRYDSYELLAKASLDSREGQEITYALGDDYGVSFRLGSVLAGQRLKLQGFRIVQKPAQGTNKGRRLEPKELIHTNLNLWMDRIFTLVLAQDDSSGEALMVAISCRPTQEAR